MDSTARVDCDKAKKDAEPHWAAFKAAHPVEYSEIKMVYDVKDYVLKVAQWMFRGDHRLSALKNMYGKLEKQAKDEDFNLEVSLATAKLIRQLLSDPNTSTIAMLTGLGERDLKTELMPSLKQAVKGKTSRIELANNELNKFQAIEVD